MSKILAVVSTSRDKVDGGAPIFFVEDENAQQEVAFLLEKILDATAHDLKNGIYILVNHSD